MEGRNLPQRRTKGKGEKRSEMRGRSQQQLFQKETKASELGEMIKKKKKNSTRKRADLKEHVSPWLSE